MQLACATPFAYSDLASDKEPKRSFPSLLDDDRARLSGITMEAGTSSDQYSRQYQGEADNLRLQNNKGGCPRMIVGGNKSEHGLASLEELKSPSFQAFSPLPRDILMLVPYLHSDLALGYSYGRVRAS